MAFIIGDPTPDNFAVTENNERQPSMIKFEQGLPLANIEGTQVPFARDVESFLACAEKYCMAALRAPFENYKDITVAVLKFFTDRHGIYSSSGYASTDMRLFCLECGGETKGSLLAVAAQCRRRCGGSHALYFYDNWSAGELVDSDLEALSNYYKHMAGLFSDESLAYCALCGSPIPRGKAYVVQSGHGSGKVECGPCVQELMESTRNKYWADASKNPNDYFGRGQLRNARNFQAGKFTRSIDLPTPLSC